MIATFSEEPGSQKWQENYLKPWFLYQTCFLGSSWQERPELHLSDLVPATLLLLQKCTRQVAPAVSSVRSVLTVISGSDAAMHWVRAGHNKSAIDIRDLYGFLQTFIFISLLFHGRGRTIMATPSFAIFCQEELAISIHQGSLQCIHVKEAERIHHFHRTELSEETFARSLARLSSLWKRRTE